MVLPKEELAPKNADKASKDVANILNEINRKNAEETDKVSTNNTKRDVKTSKPKTVQIPRGKPKSNRPWKEVKQK